MKKKILFVLTSHDQLGNTGQKTGFWLEEFAQEKLANTLVLSEVSANDYDTLFIPGGHGPMWDLVVDKNLKKLVEDFYFGRKIVSAVCHGPAGLLQAIDKDRKSIIKGKKVTGFTNSEENTVQL